MNQEQEMKEYTVEELTQIETLETTGGNMEDYFSALAAICAFFW